MKNLENIDFLLFDLGDVIINIDYAFSINELRKNLPEKKWPLAIDLYTRKFHKDFERGLIDASQFRQEVRDYFGENWSDQKIDTLWNSLLVNFPLERIELIKELNNDFRIGLLSNTNSIHIKAVNEILQRDTGIKSIDLIFENVFLSHEMDMIKPDAEIYQSVLKEIGVEAKNVLFFDDVEDNIIGAKKVGLQTFHVNSRDALIRFFEDVQ